MQYVINLQKVMEPISVSSGAVERFEVWEFVLPGSGISIENAISKVCLYLRPLPQQFNPVTVDAF